ncbi:MAG TPA: hypothetical protein PLL69_05110 [Gemmatimonadales bacterium]|nr:hypothetical protein [Gemmatimonadales bacterium]
MGRLFTTASGSGLALAAIMGRLADPSVDPERLITSMVRVGEQAGPNPPMGTQLRALGAMMAQALGRGDTALTLVRQLDTGAGGGSREFSEYIRMSPVFGGYADSTMLAAVRTALSRAPVNQYVTIWRGLVELDSGDPAAARAVIRPTLARTDTLQRWGYGALLGIDGLAMVAEGDTTRGLAALDSARTLMGSAVIGAFVQPVQLRRAVLLTRIPARRVEGLNILRYGFPGSPEYYPILQFYLGQVWENMGERDAAAASYGQFVQLWTGADSTWQPLLEDARAGLERVTGEQPAQSQ